MSEAFIIDGVHTPIGRYAGALVTPCVGVGQGVSLLPDRGIRG